MSLFELQQRIYENKVRKNFNITDISKEIILMSEENGELCDALVENNRDEIIDAFGDIMVYGLGLSAMFGLNADEIINRAPKYEKEPSDVSGHIPYLGSAVGKIAKNFKRSNRKVVSELDKRDEFKMYIGDLLGYCANALESIGENHISVLENIVSNNVDRTHNGHF